MRFNSKWNRRSFLGSVGVIASSMSGTAQIVFCESRVHRWRQPAD